MYVLHLNNIFFQNLHQLSIKVWIYYKRAFLCLFFIFWGNLFEMCQWIIEKWSKYEELKHTAFRQFGLCKVCPPVNPEGGSSETVFCHVLCLPFWNCFLWISLQAFSLQECATIYSHAFLDYTTEQWHWLGKLWLLHCGNNLLIMVSLNRCSK